MVAQTVKNPPMIQDKWVWSLGQEDPLKKGMATHFSILAWRIPWTEESEGLQSMGSQRIRHDWAAKHVHTHRHSLWLRRLFSGMLGTPCSLASFTAYGGFLLVVSLINRLCMWIPAFSCTRPLYCTTVPFVFFLPHWACFSLKFTFHTI